MIDAMPLAVSSRQRGSERLIELSRSGLGNACSAAPRISPPSSPHTSRS